MPQPHFGLTVSPVRAAILRRVSIEVAVETSSPIFSEIASVSEIVRHSSARSISCSTPSTVPRTTVVPRAASAALMTMVRVSSRIVL